ncbi:uncharacterized protein [Lepeophtheirus salmonis]|uniref:uncharacterized protein n=1 Tax=Lepeophtheirus salmonis TaxID=72036 RepID=UPI001AE5C76C|nr:uncharacterized protein LOC121131546 [Lepeophtheirus salmonis]
MNTPKRNILPCAVSICYFPHVNSGEGYSCHRFPEAKDIRAKWIQALHRQNPFNPETARICSRHFEEDYFLTYLKAELMSNYGKTFSSKVRKTLKSNVFPTLYLVHESSIRAAKIDKSNI